MPALEQTLLKHGDKVLLVGGVLKGLEALYMQSDGEVRAMVLIDLLSKPHLISYDAAHLLPQD